MGFLRTITLYNDRWHQNEIRENPEAFIKELTDAMVNGILNGADIDFEMLWTAIDIVCRFAIELVPVDTRLAALVAIGSAPLIEITHSVAFPSRASTALGKTVPIAHRLALCDRLVRAFLRGDCLTWALAGGGHLGDLVSLIKPVDASGEAVAFALRVIELFARIADTERGAELWLARHVHRTILCSGHAAFRHNVSPASPPELIDATLNLMLLSGASIGAALGRCNCTENPPFSTAEMAERVDRLVPIDETDATRLVGAVLAIGQCRRSSGKRELDATIVRRTLDLTRWGYIALPWMLRNNDDCQIDFDELLPPRASLPRGLVHYTMQNRKLWRRDVRNNMPPLAVRRWSAAIFAHRAVTVCIALQGLRLPALMLLGIVEADQSHAGEPFHVIWDLCVGVKHWRDRVEKRERERSLVVTPHRSRALAL